MDDIDKVAHYLKNNSDVVDRSDFKIPHTAWTECIRHVLDLSAAADVKEEVKSFKSAAKWLPDKGAARINQLSLRKLTTSEIIKKADDLIRTGNIQEALLYYDYAVMVLKNAANSRQIGKLLLIIGDAYCKMGNFSLALSAYEGAEVYFAKDNNENDKAELAYSRGVCFQLWGKHKEGYDYLLTAHELFTTVRNFDKAHKTLSRMSLSLSFLDPEDAIKACNDAIDFFEQQKAIFQDKLVKKL